MIRRPQNEPVASSPITGNTLQKSSSHHGSNTDENSSGISNEKTAQKSAPVKTDFGDLTLRLKKHLGRGGFGQVYFAEVNFQRVAIKVFDLGHSDEDILRVQPEIAILKELNHGHIVRFFGTCIANQRHAMVLEYANCGSLRELLKEADDELPWPTRRRFGEEISRGLAYLHSRNVVHRDLKSNNVLLFGNDLTVKLADFGLSVIKNREVSYVSAGLAGAMRWKCKEELRKQARHLSEFKACDIYSAGMIFWEITTKKLPFVEMDEIGAAIAICNGKQETIPDTVPEHLKAIIRDCWKPLQERPSAEGLIPRFCAGC